MAESKQIYKMPYYETPQHELVELPTGAMVRRFTRRSADDLLFRTLPIALAAKSINPLAAWMRFFNETEP